MKRDGSIRVNWLQKVAVVTPTLLLTPPPRQQHVDPGLREYIVGEDHIGTGHEQRRVAPQAREVTRSDVGLERAIARVRSRG